MITKAKNLLEKLENLSSNRKVDCYQISSIKDINAMFKYEDVYKQGKGDEKRISCGQSKGYNELKRFYDIYLRKFVKDRIITEKQALKAICECCKEIDYRKRTHERFKECVVKKLEIKL